MGRSRCGYDSWSLFIDAVLFEPGAIGMGDGLFFIVSAIFLGFWTSIALLLFGLMFCSACSLGIVCWGIAAGVNVRKKRLPFLPFLLPAWILVRLF